MIKVQINRKRWLRGEGSNVSRLLRESDGKSCCLGFVERKRGAKKHHILGKAILNLASNSAHVDPKLISNFKPFEISKGFTNEAICALYLINDNRAMNDTEREINLIENGKRIGIQFQFVG